MNDNVLLFRNRYRIPSTRKHSWDYADAGTYFVTICTKGKMCWFGNIQNYMMCLSEIGSIVAEEWIKTSDIRPYVTLDRWIVMPNHIHGILIIHRRVETTRWDVSMGSNVASSEMNKLCAPPTETCAPHVSTANTNHIPRPPSGSLGMILNQFKSTCTKRIRTMGYDDFSWQPRFHDHVIRSESDLIRIREYIVKNPIKWQFDDLFMH